MVAPTRPSIPRPRWQNREQVGVGDQTSISTLMDQGLQQYMGALIGKANGVCAPFTVVYTSGVGVYVVAFSPFQFYLSTPLLTNSSNGDIVGWYGSLHVFDPAAPGQSNVWSIATARAAAAASDAANAYPFIYARPQALDTDVDARVVFTTARTTTAIPTRVRPVIEIKFSPLAESDSTNEGWSRIGQVTAWSSYGSVNPGTPTLTPITFWDDPNVSATIGEGVDFAAVTMSPPPSRAQLLLDGIVDGDTPNSLYNTQDEKSMGIVQMLAAVRSRLTLLLSDDSTYTWISKMAANMTIKGLRAAIVALQATDAKLAVSQALAAGFYTFSAGPPTYTLNAGTYTISGPAVRASTGELTIPLYFPLGAVVIYAVHVTGQAACLIPRASWTSGSLATHTVSITLHADDGTAVDGPFSFSVVGAYT